MDETSSFIARLLGPPMLLAGLSLIAHPAFYRIVAEDIRRSRGLLYLIGMMRLLAGIAIVLVHNVWVADWRILITLIGWLALIRGAAILVAPEAVLAWTGQVFAHDAMLPLVAAAAILLGGTLSFVGYV